MARVAVEKKGEVVAIMQNGCHGRPRRGLFSLSRATDEPQMDGQLLWVSELGEGGVTRGGAGGDVYILRRWYAGQRGHLGVKV